MLLQAFYANATRSISSRSKTASGWRSRPSSIKALKVEVRGIEPLSLGDHSGLLRAQPGG